MTHFWATCGKTWATFYLNNWSQGSLFTTVGNWTFNLSCLGPSG